MDRREKTKAGRGDPALEALGKIDGAENAKGKDRSSLNAIKHGDRSRVWQEYAYALTLNRQFVRQIKKTVLMDRKRLLLTKELLEKRL